MIRVTRLSHVLSSAFANIRLHFTHSQKDKDDLQEVSQDLEELELEADEDTKVQ